MNSGVAVYSLAPQEYRVALDAACAWLATALPASLSCESDMLKEECLQRLSFTPDPPWRSVLWVEPQVTGWENLLEEYSRALISGARLAVVISLPLVKQLPERRGWEDQPLGWQRDGLAVLAQNITRQRFSLVGVYGLHSGQSILLNKVASAGRRLGAFSYADRMEFMARGHYTKPLGKAWWATCGLVLAERD